MIQEAVITGGFLLLALALVQSQSQEIGCFVEGECVNGTAVGISVVEDVWSCVQFCRDREACNHFTFDPAANNVCLALEDCPLLSTDNCPDCVSGDESCPTALCLLEGKS